jgi:serine/threonine protein kinase
MPPEVDSPVDPIPAHYTKTPGAEPIAGYRLIKPLGMGTFGEVWRCEAPGGLPKAIKFVPGSGDEAVVQSYSAAQQELQALQHCKTIRHPFILSMERVELQAGELIIVMELADKSLHDVYTECRSAGRPGMARGELLAYLREAAEVLDFLFHEHGLQHLDIKPHNLFLISKHIKVADFGLVSSLAERRGQGQQLACGTPLYAAPEAFKGQPTQHSDQYSLAITYQELLTGTLPFQGKNSRQLMMQHLQAEPELEALGPRDRPLVAKALAKDPEQRFPSCLEFIHSLMYERVVISSVTQAQAGLQDPTQTPGQGFLDETLPAAEAGGEAQAAVAAVDAIPGHELVRCQSRSVLTDHWSCVGPGGRERRAQLLHAPPYRGAVVVDKLCALTHPGLLPHEVLRSASGRIFVIDDTPESNLTESYAACRREGLPGVPRPELLACLREVGKTLDDVLREHRLPHLALQPRHIVLQGDRTLVAQLGMVALLWPLQVRAAASLNSRYAAPELYEPGFSPSSDQYSLALIYAEMLLGMQPRPGRSGGGRGLGKLDLELMPAFDRRVLARALADDPGERFGSCVEFIDALVSAAASASTLRRRTAPDVVHSALLAAGKLEPAPPGADVEAVAATWVLAANNARGFQIFGNRRCLVFADNVIEHRYPVRIIPGALKLKLVDFPKQWQAKLVKVDAANFVCRIHAPSTFWDRCFGGESGIEIHISAQCLDDPNPQLVEAVVRLQFYGKTHPRFAAMLGDIAPRVLDSVHNYLQDDFDRRGSERWPCSWIWKIYALDREQQPGAAVEVASKDLSLTGIGFIASEPLASDLVYVTPAHLPQDYAALVRIVRHYELDDGRVEHGGVFGAIKAAQD